MKKELISLKPANVFLLSNLFLVCFLIVAASPSLKAQESVQQEEQTREIIPVFEKAREKNVKNSKNYSSSKSLKTRVRVQRTSNSGLKQSVARLHQRKNQTIGNSSVSKKVTVSKNQKDTKTPIQNDGENKKNFDSFSLEKAQKLGVTLWKMEANSENDTSSNNKAADSRSLVHPINDFVPLRVNHDSVFRVGEKIRLSVESPTEGYLYVVNCEVYADESVGKPTLIFPTRRTRGGVNFLTSGSPIEFPAITDSPNYFEFKLSGGNGKQAVAEALIFIVTKSPISNFEVPTDAVVLKEDQLQAWERKWAGKTEIWELENGAGKKYTQAEYESAIEIRRQGEQSNGRALKIGEPEPQTLYAVESGAGDGMMFTLFLRYQ